MLRGSDSQDIDSVRCSRRARGWTKEEDRLLTQEIFKQSRLAAQKSSSPSMSEKTSVGTTTKAHASREFHDDIESDEGQDFETESERQPQRSTKTRQSITGEFRGSSGSTSTDGARLPSSDLRGKDVRISENLVGRREYGKGHDFEQDRASDRDKERERDRDAGRETGRETGKGASADLGADLDGGLDGDGDVDGDADVDVDVDRWTSRSRDFPLLPRASICWAGVAHAILRLSEGRHKRTPKQCSQRWARVLDPSIRRIRWTAEEDRALHHGVATLGASAWSRIAAFVPGRTDIQCRSRWLQLRQHDAVAPSVHTPPSTPVPAQTPTQLAHLDTILSSAPIQVPVSEASLMTTSSTQTMHSPHYPHHIHHHNILLIQAAAEIQEQTASSLHHHHHHHHHHHRLFRKQTNHRIAIDNLIDKIPH